MKGFYPYVIRAIVFGLLLAVLGCDQILEQIDAINITVAKDIAEDEDLAAEATHIPILQNGRITGGTLSKAAAVSGFIEAEITVSDYELLIRLAEEGFTHLSGTVANDAANEVVFGIYLSDQSGLADPVLQADEIASVVIGALESVSLEDLSTYAAVLSDYFDSHPGASTLTVYLTASGDPAVDVRIENLHLTMGSSVDMTQMIAYEDRIVMIPVRKIADMRGFLEGIDTAVEREPDRV